MLYWRRIIYRELSQLKDRRPRSRDPMDEPNVETPPRAAYRACHPDSISYLVCSCFAITLPATATRKTCCRKETARYRSCSFRFKVRRQHPSFESQASELQTYQRKTEFNAKWLAIQGHSRSRVLESVERQSGTK